jgi:preprotein translocase subunit SecE
MATKAAIVSGANPLAKIIGNVVEQWKEFTRFLTDVRAEMRKVVTPTWKEVKSTTTVVIIAVGIFGLYFFVVDSICSKVMEALYHKLGG